MSERFQVRITGSGSPDKTFTVCTLNGPFKAAALAALHYAMRWPEGHVLAVEVEPLGRADPQPDDLIDRVEW